MADNLFLIATKQLRSADFSGYVLGIMEGNFNPLLSDFVQGGGNLGSNFLYTTGTAAQNVQGNVYFLSNIYVPYSGASGAAPSQQFVLDQVAALQAQISSTNLNTNWVAHLTGAERFSGTKTFENIFINSGVVTGNFSVPLPVGSGNAVPLIYLQNQLSATLNGNLLTTTGTNQLASGLISFFNGGTIYIPVATNPSGAVPLIQLSNTGTNILSNLTSVINNLYNTGANLQAQINNLDLEAASSVTGFGGVLTFNAQSGNIFSQGRGSVTCTQVGNIFNVSGATPASYTGAFLGFTKITSGVYTQFINYGQTFSSIPCVYAQIDNSSGDPLLSYNISGKATNGFNLVFSNQVPTANYGVSYFAFTGSGNILTAFAGPQGAPSLIPQSPISFNSYFPNFVTGSGLHEQLTSQNFIITGFAISARVSGSGAFTSGNIYSVSTTNIQTNVTGFRLAAGSFYSGVNCYSNPIFVTGPGHLGIDILSASSGMNKVAVSIFGYGA